MLPRTPQNRTVNTGSTKVRVLIRFFPSFYIVGFCQKSYRYRVR